jgi:Outer membrane protein beta-barrel domain
MTFVRLAGASLVSLLLVAAPVRADILLTPFVGGTFGGSASSQLADIVGDQSKTTFGGSIAIMSAGVFGVEGDLGYTPKFFGTDLQVAGVPVSLAQNNVLTAMGNLMLGIPLQNSNGPGVRPYAVAGIGLIRQRLNLASGLVGYTVKDLGYDVGGGVLVFFSRNVGIRGDLRYFRTLGGNTISDLIDLQPGAFNFTRASVGVTFRY